jgi:hypothetical protein
MVLKVYDEATDEESMKLAALMKDPEPTDNPKAEKTLSVPRAAAAKSKAPPPLKNAQRGYNLMKTELSLLEGSIFTKNRSADQRQVA